VAALVNCTFLWNKVDMDDSESEMSARDMLLHDCLFHAHGMSMGEAPYIILDFEKSHNYPFRERSPFNILLSRRQKSWAWNEAGLKSNARHQEKFERVG